MVRKGQDLLQGRWARDYAHCTHCGTTEIPHMSKGLCGACYRYNSKMGHLPDEKVLRDRARRGMVSTQAVVKIPSVFDIPPAQVEPLPTRTTVTAQKELSNVDVVAMDTQGNVLFFGEVARLLVRPRS